MTFKSWVAKNSMIFGIFPDTVIKITTLKISQLNKMLCQMTIAIMSANLYFEFRTFCLLTKIIHWVLVLIATFLKQNYFRGMDCNLQWYILPRTRPFATVTHLILNNVKVFNNSLDFINAECFVRQDCTLRIRQHEKNINIDVSILERPSVSGIIDSVPFRAIWPYSKIF